MEIVTISTRSVRVAVVFEATDAVTGQAPVSEVSVRVAGIEQIPRLVDDRYIVFVDLPESEYEVLVEARDYQLDAPVFFNPAALNLIEEVVPLNLSPRVSYPFPPDSTLLYGEVFDEQGMGVAGARVEVMGGPHDGTFTNTDATGRCVLFFDESNNSRNINLIVSKASYENRAVTTTILKGESVNFSAQLDRIGGPNIAVLRGQVVDVANLIVTQADVSVSPWNVSAQTDCDGRFLIEQSVSGDENVTLSVSQDGFADQSLPVSAIQGGIVDLPVVMNLNILPNTAGLGVEVVDNAGFLEGAVVEIVEKNRAAMTNADGLARFFFNDLNREREDVTIRVRKIGYVDKTVRRTIRQGRTVRQTVRLRLE